MFSIKNDFLQGYSVSEEELHNISMAISKIISREGAKILNADEKRINFKVNPLITLLARSPLSGIRSGYIDFTYTKNELKVLSKARYAFFILFYSILLIVAGLVGIIIGEATRNIFCSLGVFWLLIVGLNIFVSNLKFRRLIESSINTSRGSRGQ